METSIGPFTGYRFWRIFELFRGEAEGRVSSSSLMLGSVYAPYVWPPFQAAEALLCTRTTGLTQFEQTKFCLEEEADQNETIPSWKGRCGLFAYRDLPRTLADFSAPVLIIGTVIGRVALWGDTVECDDGFRSEYAYPQSLTLAVCFECKARRSLKNIQLVAVHRKEVFSPSGFRSLAFYCNSCSKGAGTALDGLELLAQRYGIPIEEPDIKSLMA